MCVPVPAPAPTCFLDRHTSHPGEFWLVRHHLVPSCIEQGPCPYYSAWYPGAIGEGLRVVQPHRNLAIKMCNVTAKLYVDKLTVWLAIVFSYVLVSCTVRNVLPVPSHIRQSMKALHSTQLGVVWKYSRCLTWDWDFSANILTIQAKLGFPLQHLGALP